MTAEEVIPRINVELAHLWMIRTFLKHAEEIQEDADILEVPRTLFDSIRAVEPARERGDTAEFLRRLRGKMSKLRRVAEFFSNHYRQFSVHTNFEMAAVSLTGAVNRLQELLETVRKPETHEPEALATDDSTSDG